MRKVILALIMISMLSLAATEIEIKRDNTALRKGPASYYQVLAKIPARTRVQQQKQLEGWLQVQYQNLQGYIAGSAITDKKLKNDPFAGVSVKPGNVTASDHAVSAGVKGFARQFGSMKDFIPDPSFLDTATNYTLDMDSFSQAQRLTYNYSDPGSYYARTPLPSNDMPDYFTEAQEGFGLAVAAKISSSGLYASHAVNAWVRNTGQIVVDAAFPSDIPYRFFVLDIDAPNAYACPGGFIFITIGLVNLLQSDAELAFILAHEIAHVCRFHGLLEIKERENQINSDYAFEELDLELPDAYDVDAKRTEAELEAEISNIFEYLVNGRMQSYEKEADQLGLIFAARAGFNPAAAKAILKRIYNTAFTPANEHYTKDNIKARLGWLEDELKRYSASRDAWLPDRTSFNIY